MKRLTQWIALLTALLLLFCGCSKDGTTVSSTQTGTEAVSVVSEQTGTEASAPDGSALFSSRDLEGTYEAREAIAITLTGDTAVCDSSAVTVEGSTVTITAAGTYVLSGSLEDGTILVNAAKDDKIQLVLEGVALHAEDFAAIYVAQADKVFITLAAGTINTLSNGGSYTQIDDNNVDAVIPSTAQAVWKSPLPPATVSLARTTW